MLPLWTVACAAVLRESITIITYRKEHDQFINTVKDNKQCFPIYNQRLAGWLMTKGYVLMDMKPNKKYAGRNVFYFVDSVALKTSVDEFFHLS